MESPGLELTASQLTDVSINNALQVPGPRNCITSEESGQKSREIILK